MPKDRKEILDNFIEQDISYAANGLHSKNFGRSKMGGTIAPRDAKETLKNTWLAGVDIRKDYVAYLRKVDDPSYNYKQMSRHKQKTGQNLVERHSSMFVVDVIRVHHFLTFAVLNFVNPENTSFNFQNLTENPWTLTRLLKTDGLKETLDTDEISTLYLFNKLRNSLAHSSGHAAFTYMDKEYYEEISNLLDEVETIYIWFYKNIELEILMDGVVYKPEDYQLSK